MDLERREEPAPGRPLPSRGLERLTDLPLALAVRAVGSALGRIGPRGAYGFAGILGSAWHRLVPRRRKIALRNLEIAFRGSLSLAERKRIARESFRHAMATAVDVFLRDRAMAPESWRRVVAMDPELEALLSRPHPRGLAVLSAHLGDWELGHHVFALLDQRPVSIARRIHNPHLDLLATRLRSRRGASVVPKAGAFQAIRNVLREGGVVGLLTDQSAPPGERFARFFGAAASTYFQYARLLARLRPEAALVVCVRDGFRFLFRLIYRDLTEPLRGAGGEDARAEALVRAYLDGLEALVRAHPEQYLWMHRRWKIRPPGAPDLYGNLGEPLDLSLLDRESPP